MLVEVCHDFSEVGFVEVPGNDTCSVRVFVDVAAELVVEFGQSQASICLRWDIDGSNDDRCKLPGQVEWAAFYLPREFTYPRKMIFDLSFILF